MMPTFDVLVVGEINPDLILSGDVTPSFGQVEKILDDAALTVGSSACIFACGAARLGLKVAFIGKVGGDGAGPDLFGRFMIDRLKARGVDIGGVVVDHRLKTGLSVILSRGSDRAILTYGGSIPALSFDDIPLQRLKSARHLHLTSFYMLDRLRPDVPRLFSLAHGLGLTTSLDTNYDPSGQWQGGLQDALAHSDIFFPNQTELAAVGGEVQAQAALARLTHGGRIVAAKLGAQGAIARQGLTLAAASAPAVEVIDTTGAGDSFDAGFVYAFLKQWGLSDALRLGCICGSLSTRRAGGVDAQPTLEEAMELFLDVRPG